MAFGLEDRAGAAVTRRGLLEVAAAAGAVAALPARAEGAARRGRPPPRRRRYDVIVVGAGLAGLTAATSVSGAGRSTLVLEARARVGGRNLDIPIGSGDVVELGGQWTGPGQDRVQALAKRLGVGLFPTYATGSDLYHRGGTLQTYTGGVPPASPAALTELVRAIGALNTAAAGVSAARPWTAGGAGDYDIQTIGGWIDGQAKTDEARALLKVAISGVYGEDGGQISLLDLLAQITGVGGDINTLVGSAQSVRFEGGPQRLSQGLAARLKGSVRLSSPVVVVEHGARPIVHTRNASFRARQVILTPPKPVLARIHFSPELPPAYSQYLQRQPMGSTIKVQAVYDTPFWRTRGLSGAVVSDTGPIQIVYDNSPPGGKPGVLVGFIEGDQARALFSSSPAQRRAAALASLVRYFGPAAARPRRYLDMVWAREQYTLGAYGVFNPPGVLTSLGALTDGPVGSLHFAGDGYAPLWPGYMDGAISSGEHAAREALSRL